LFENFDIHIDFAYKTFRCYSEARLKAILHCVIVGFSSAQNSKERLLFDSNTVKKVKNINAYLIDAPDIFVQRRTKPICNVPSVYRENQPTDGGNLIIEEDEYEDFIAKEPKAKKYIKRFMMGNEFINNKKRYCLWLVNASPKELNSMPYVMECIRKVKEMREKSTFEPTRKMALTPFKFREEINPDTFIAIPKTSSEKRKYIPIGYLDSNTISGDSIRIIENATLYHFGVLTSNVHMAWMRAVCGRLKSDYSYSIFIVYNNFPWCTPTDAQKAKIEQTAQAVLDARAKFPDSSLADLYDELTMPPELRKAHQANDFAVMAAYGFDRKITESECVAGTDAAVSGTGKGGRRMKPQASKTPVSAELHRRRMQSVAGTMAIEGIPLSEASRHNLDRYASGQASYQQLMAELRAKYQRAK
ncbi:MAG: antitoxin VbhA family protein, partial [Ruminococcus sp.]|nr:antitoxin VbhA family protein [Ruminococcus sp.]